MNELIAFLLATIISFWGSIQLGPVNVCVIETALAHGKKQALTVAIGGVIPEIIYSALAVVGANIIVQYPQMIKAFEWIIIVLLFLLGIYYFFKPFKDKEIKPSAGAGFLKGFFLAAFNPQLFPFWLAILVYLRGYVDFEKGSFISPYLSFVVGTAVGAWLLLFTFTQLTVAYETKLKNVLKSNLNKMVGCLFFLMALLELVRRLW